VIAGPPALVEGTMLHRRVVPQPHQFNQPISQVWIDPDQPEQLCDLHPAWSHRRPAPARFRRSDYGDRPTGSLVEAARGDLSHVLGRTPQGPVRMLSQIRRWGWLFNPITFFFVWDEPNDSAPKAQRPVGAILEVTNTPWKERTRYPLVFDTSDGCLTAEFDKAMHVSPFLTMDHRYRLIVQDRDDLLAVDIDVVDPDGQAVLHTKLRLQRRQATRQLLGDSLRSQPFPTHRVSAGIHRQATWLWAKGVPVVAHPTKSSATPAASSSPIEGKP
jgi:uncharacterized protein